VDRTNILASVDDPGDVRGVVGWFDYDKIKGRWSDADHDGNGSRGTGRGTAVILTGGGKWVHEDWTRWQGEATTWTYTTPEKARDWLLRNNEDATVTEHFGEIPGEEDRRPGRPEIGGRITTALGGELARVDAYAELHEITRAEAVRRLVSAGLAAGPLTFEYETVNKSAVPAGLIWVEDGRETSSFTEVAYAGSASGGEGSPWRRITSHPTRTVEYARLVS
jgi:hypothetical protein